MRGLVESGIWSRFRKVPKTIITNRNREMENGILWKQKLYADKYCNSNRKTKFKRDKVNKNKYYIKTENFHFLPSLSVNSFPKYLLLTGVPVGGGGGQDLPRWLIWSSKSAWLQLQRMGQKLLPLLFHPGHPQSGVFAGDILVAREVGFISPFQTVLLWQWWSPNAQICYAFKWGGG